MFVKENPDRKKNKQKTINVKRVKGYYNKYYLSHDANCNMTNI